MYIYTFVVAVGSWMSGAGIKVETEVEVPKLMAEYWVKWKHYRCYMLPQIFMVGKKALISYNLLMTAFQIKKGGEKGKQEMQLLDDKEELRVNNR